MPKLTQDFYLRDDVVQIAKDLLGKALFTSVNGKVTAGMVVETEAYSGRNDRACHADQHRRTRRTEIMFSEGGMAYVYLCYGIHHLFNVVTNVEGMADAVLIRALEPLDGLDEMMLRRKMNNAGKRLTSGPGVLTQAMGIRTEHYGLSLLGDRIWFEDIGAVVTMQEMQAAKRIGVDYAGEDALKPWRFYIKENHWVSRL